MTVIVVLALTCLALLAGPAFARDPFDPVIDVGQVTTGSTGGVSTGGVTEPVFQPGIGSEGLANTGTDISPWLVIAYGLLALGGGTLVLVRLNAPRRLVARR
jgi:hypothetical protein